MTARWDMHDPAEPSAVVSGPTSSIGLTSPSDEPTGERGRTLPTYADLEILIGRGEQETYPVSIVRSPAGEARRSMSLEIDAVLRADLERLDDELARSGLVTRRANEPEPSSQSITRIGRRLFDALFAGELLSIYDVSRHDAKRSGRGLRIDLRCEDPGLAGLPWELLYDERAGDFITLSTNTPVVRYLSLAQTIEPLAIDAPLRILAIAAAPTDLRALDIAAERNQLERSIAPLAAEGVIELRWLERATWRDLQETLRREQWHVLHFVGHGMFDRAVGEGVIMLVDDLGLADRVTATNLGRLLGDHQELRLVVLNSCGGATGDSTDLFSSTAATIVRRGTPAVIAMQRTITDGAATEFAEALYAAITDGLPIDAAVVEARKAICLAIPDSLEWATPILLTHALDTQLFTMHRPLAARVTSADQPSGLARRRRLLRIGAAVAIIIGISAGLWATLDADRSSLTIDTAVVTLADLPSGWSTNAIVDDRTWPCGVDPSPPPIRLSAVSSFETGKLEANGAAVPAVQASSHIVEFDSTVDAAAALRSVDENAKVCRTTFPSAAVPSHFSYTPQRSTGLGDESVELIYAVEPDDRATAARTYAPLKSRNLLDGAVAFIRRDRYILVAAMQVLLSERRVIDTNISDFYQRADTKFERFVG